jgi:taurine dioxygenase
MATTLDLRPVIGAFGAEVRGLTLSDGIDDDTVSALRQAWLEHGVLFWRDQPLGPDGLAAVGRRFGPLEQYPFVEPIPGHPEVIAVVKEPGDRANFGGGWHTDLVYRPEPSAATMLHAVEIPRRGGDTLFADGEAAHRALSERMRELLAGLRVVYDVAIVRRHLHERSDGATGYGRSMTPRAGAGDGATVTHPVIRTHPETGRPALYFSREHTERFDGMTITESRPLLDWLQEHLTAPEFTTRFRWEPGSLAFWDNRRVGHRALDDYPGQRRVMHRITIAGDTPR